jgi:curved DNA-binding protein CbpA
MIFSSHKDRNLYQMLGVPTSVSPQQLQEVVSRLRKIFAPGSYPEALPGLQALALHRLEEINQAFEILGDPERRHRYDQELDLPPNVVPILPTTSFHRVLARSVASVGEELLTQNPDLSWRRSHKENYDLVATAQQDEDIYEIRFRIVPRIRIEDFREFLYSVQTLLEEASRQTQRRHLTFLLAASLVEDLEQVRSLLLSFHEESWPSLEGPGARARVFVLQGPSGHILAPGGVSRDTPALNPRRLVSLNQRDRKAA